MGKGAYTHYEPGPRMQESTAVRRQKRKRNSVRKELPEPLRTELESLRSELPDSLLEELNSIGQRTLNPELNSTIERLCGFRPFGLHELSLLLGRNEVHLRTRCVKRLITEGRLGYFYPVQPNHPKQKYIAVGNSME